MKTIITTAATAFVAIFALNAQAAPDVEPSARLSRTTEITMDNYKETQIVRERSPNKKLVAFRAEDAKVDKRAEVRFRVFSETDDGKSVERWSCVARENVRECFEKPVRVHYLPQDARMVMKVAVVPAQTPNQERFAQR